jgi:hypothetical protein
VFKVIGGDIPNNATCNGLFGRMAMSWNFGKDSILLNGNITSIEKVTEENKKKFTGAAGWGLVGGLALGPLGLIAGVLKGGNKKEIAFVAELKDGRKFMAVADPKMYQAIYSASLE